MIRNFIEKIKINIKKMSSKKKLIYSILFLVFMLILYRLIVINDSDSEIDYSNIINGESIYSSTTYLEDLDTYAQLNTIANDFILTCSGRSYMNGKEMSLDSIYKYCTYNGYKKSISKGNFIDKANNFYSKLQNYADSNGNYIPDNIVQYTDNFYLIKYLYADSSDDQNSHVECYLGIALDNIRSKYYIWYVE